MTSSEMREPTFLVLSALAEGRLHGYALIGEVERMSDRRVRLRPGTLYAVLDRLREGGLVAAVAEEVVDSRLRRYYELTDAGAACLEVEAERLAGNAEQAVRRLRLRAARSAGPA